MREHGKLKIEPAYLGLSAAIATLLVYEPALHSFVNFGHFDEFIPLFSASALASCAFCAVACAVFASRRPLSPIVCETAFVGALFASAAVGSVGFLWLVAFSGPMFLQVVIGLCAGASSALVLVSWGYAFAGCSVQQALMHIALSSIVGALLMNAMGTLPFPVTTIIFGALSAAAAVVPVAMNKRRMATPPAAAAASAAPGDAAATPPAAAAVVTADAPAATPSAAAVPVTPAPSAPSSAAPTASEASCAHSRSARRMVGSLIEPLAGLFLFSLVFATLGDHHVYLFYLSFLLGTLLSGLCIIPLLLVNSRRPILSLIFQVVLPLLGLILVAVVLVVPDGQAGLVARTGFMLFFSFASMLFCASTVGFATAEEFDPGLIFGAAVAAFALGGLLGAVLAATVGRGDLVTGVFLALTCAYIISLAIRPSLVSWMGKDVIPLPQPAGEGEGAADPGIEALVDAAAEAYGLTMREREILGHVVAGRSSSTIARTLFISESTVRGHVHHLYGKLGAASRDEIVRIVMRGGAALETREVCGACGAREACGACETHETHETRNAARPKRLSRP